MADNDIEKLREEVNPVFNTAQSCLRVNAELGDQDAKNMLEKLGMNSILSQTKSDDMTPEMMTFVKQKLSPGFNIMVETRFAASTKLILDSGKSQVVDLPCGYTPRGLKLSRKKIRYFGMDLPAVTDAVAPAVQKIIGNNELISYHAVDATNYTSIRKVLNNASSDEFIITTEGLLMYMTQSELEEVFHNIHRLLIEFGGMWVTTDNEMIQGQNKMLALLADGNVNDIATIEKLTKEKMAKVAPSGNAFLDRNNVEHFIKDMGFNLEKVPMFNYLPERLRSMDNLPQNKQQAARELFKEVFFWVMTPMSADSYESVCEEKDFKAEMKFSCDTLRIVLSGRLDTITAPTLLAMYRETADKENNISHIIIDMKNLDYISSAGIRVLIIMNNELKNNNQLILTGMNEIVREIIENVGLDELFSC